MAVGKRLRYEVLRRDNHACRYCGATAPGAELTIDHVVPTALGGTDEPSNLVAACRDCNAGKSASSPDAPLVDQVREDVLRWREAMALAAQVDHLEWDERDERRLDFHDAWVSWTYESGGRRVPLDLPVDWPASIDRFVAAGLTGRDLREAIDQAMRRPYLRDVFKYFCGICWGLISQRQQLVVTYLEQTEEASGGS